MPAMLTPPIRQCFSAPPASDQTGAEPQVMAALTQKVIRSYYPGAAMLGPVLATHTHTGPDKSRLAVHVLSPAPLDQKAQCICQPAGRICLCKWDKERHSGLKCLLWSRTVAR